MDMDALASSGSQALALFSSLTKRWPLLIAERRWKALEGAEQKRDENNLDVWCLRYYLSILCVFSRIVRVIWFSNLSEKVSCLWCSKLLSRLSNELRCGGQTKRKHSTENKQAQSARCSHVKHMRRRFPHWDVTDVAECGMPMPRTKVLGQKTLTQTVTNPFEICEI